MTSDLKNTIINLQVQEDMLAIIFMGQAGVILKDPQGKLYCIDVYFTDCCEREFGFKRLMPKLLAPSDLVFDYILTTHGHYDHFDVDAMPILMNNDKTRLYTTKDGIGECEKLGITSRVLRINKGDTLTIGNIKLTAVFCDHGELAPDAVGFLIEAYGKKIYLVGDSCYRPDKIEYLRKENINVMFVPINGAFGNLNEMEAVCYVDRIKPEKAVPCHYGNFAEHGGSVEKYNEIFAQRITDTQNVNMKIGDMIFC